MFCSIKQLFSDKLKTFKFSMKDYDQSYYGTSALWAKYRKNLRAPEQKTRYRVRVTKEKKD